MRAAWCIYIYIWCMYYIYMYIWCIIYICVYDVLYIYVYMMYYIYMCIWCIIYLNWAAAAHRSHLSVQKQQVEQSISLQMYSNYSNNSPVILMLSCVDQAEPSFGLLFDIDGVLVRGRTPIPAAKRAFQKLLDAQGRFVLPLVFVTNAGNCLRQKKADQLSHILGVPVSPDSSGCSLTPLITKFPRHGNNQMMWQ